MSWWEAHGGKWCVYAKRILSKNFRINELLLKKHIPPPVAFPHLLVYSITILIDLSAHKVNFNCFWFWPSVKFMIFLYKLTMRGAGPIFFCSLIVKSGRPFGNPMEARICGLLANERPKKLHLMAQTYIHTDKATLWPTRPSGAKLVKILKGSIIVWLFSFLFVCYTNNSSDVTLAFENAD